MDVPLLVPRGPLRHLRAAEDLHEVRDAIGDETVLALAFGVRPVEARGADGSLLQKDQSSSEGLPAIHGGICRRVSRIEKHDLRHVPGSPTVRVISTCSSKPELSRQYRKCGASHVFPLWFKTYEIFFLDSSRWVYVI